MKISQSCVKQDLKFDILYLETNIVKYIYVCTVFGGNNNYLIIITKTLGII